MSDIIHSDKAPIFQLPFSQAVRAGDFVYVSGQVGVYPETRELAANSIAEQTVQCLRNIEIILQEAGLTLDHVVKTTAHLAKSEDIPAYNLAYESMMTKPFPARTTVQSGIGNYLVEIDVIAYSCSRRGEV